MAYYDLASNFLTFVQLWDEGFNSFNEFRIFSQYNISNVETCTDQQDSSIFYVAVWEGYCYLNVLVCTNGDCRDVVTNDWSCSATETNTTERYHFKVRFSSNCQNITLKNRNNTLYYVDLNIRAPTMWQPYPNFTAFDFFYLTDDWTYSLSFNQNS